MQPDTISFDPEASLQQFVILSNMNYYSNENQCSRPYLHCHFGTLGLECIATIYLGAHSSEISGFWYDLNFSPTQ